MTPENKKLFCDSRNHCKKVLRDARSNYAETTRRSVASQLIGSLPRSLPYLTTSTYKPNLFARNFSWKQLPDFPSRTEQRLNSKNITSIMVSCVIYDFVTTGPNRIPAIVLKMCSPELSPYLAKLYNKYMVISFLLEIFICWKSLLVVLNFKNDGERSDPGKYRPISLLPIISNILESFINDRLNKHLDITGLFSDLPSVWFSCFPVHC